MASNTPTLLVEDLKTYFYTKAGVAKAVDGVSFSVAKGEVLGLVGESGSGKTVTGFSIIGLVDPPGKVAGGRILFNGEDITGAGEERMRRLRGSRIALQSPKRHRGEQAGQSFFLPRRAVARHEVDERPRFRHPIRLRQRRDRRQRRSHRGRV